jgi:hypothetical protein
MSIQGFNPRNGAHIRGQGPSHPEHSFKVTFNCSYYGLRGYSVSKTRRKIQLTETRRLRSEDDMSIYCTITSVPDNICGIMNSVHLWILEPMPRNQLCIYSAFQKELHNGIPNVQTIHISGC